MTALATEVIRFEQGGRTVLWHRRTGRHVALDPATLERIDEPRMAPVRARLAREFLLSGGPQAVPAELIPCRSRLVLLLPEEPALWVPVPAVHTAGGHAYRALPLEPGEVAAWRAMNEARTSRQVADRAGVPLDTVLGLLERLTAPRVQAAQLRASPPRPRDPSLARLVAPPREPGERTPDQRDDAGGTTLRAYHLHGIDDGATHFDDRETTVAHALGLPHPALGDRPYGAALHAALEERGWLQSPVVEVGCGTGEMAASFPHRPYLRVDLSPELLRTQATTAPDTQGILGDAVALPLREGAAGLVLSNEVIADLAAVPWAPGEGGPVGERVRAHDLAPLPERGPYNLGAWRLIEEIARVLRPGGHAFVSEFGTLHGAPEEARQLDHPEVSIHFGHLRRVAEGCGLRAEVLPLAEVLGVDLQARQLARHSHRALRALARRAGVHLPARAWTPAQLEGVLPWPVEGLQWVPMTDEGPGPLITRFLALLLTRPG